MDGFLKIPTTNRSVQYNMESLRKAEEYLSRIKDDLHILQSMDPKEMYAYLIEKGNQLSDFPQEWKTDRYCIKGCTSRVYIVSELQDGHIFYHGWADALVVRGYLAILIDTLSGLLPETIDDTQHLVHRFAEEINIESMLSTSRANAFSNMYEEMRKQAKQFRN